MWFECITLNCYGGCFNGEAMILLVNGKIIRVRDLKKKKKKRKKKKKKNKKK